MLEFFRRHKGAFLITLTVIIIISFSVWGGWKKSGHGPSFNPEETAFTIYGKNYSHIDAKRLQNQMQLVRMLQLFELFIGLNSAVQSEETRGGDFLFNSIVLKQEMTKLGIKPTDEEAKAALEKLPALQENGKFSLQRAKMAEASLGMYGMDSSDMLEVMKLDIGYRKLQELVSGNYEPSAIEVEKEYASRYQTLKVSTINFTLDEFKKAAQVTDEVLKKYYDENKENYKTAEKRAISYVFFEEPKEETPKADDKKTPEQKAADEKKAAEEFQKKRDALVDRVDAFDTAIIKGGKLADVAASLKEKVLKLPAFARDTAPDAIKEDSELIEEIFSFDRDSRAASSPIKGSKGYYIFTVDSVEEPKQQELAEVKDKVKEVLVNQKAQEALSKAVNDARTALQDGLKAGKKIEDLAKEKKLTLTPQVELSQTEPTPSLPNATTIAEAAKDTPAGQITKVIDTDTGATLAYVYSKELRKRDDSAVLRKNVAESLQRTEQNRIFNAWFSKKREEANLRLAVASRPL